MIQKSYLLQYISVAIFIARSDAFVVTPRNPPSPMALPLRLQAAAEDSEFALEKAIEVLLYPIERLEKQLQQAKKHDKGKWVQMIEEEKEKLLCDKEDRIEEIELEMELLIKEKDEYIETLDNLIAEKYEQLLQVKAERSMLGATFGPETDVLPLVEYKVRQWYRKEMMRGESARFTTEEAFKAFAEEKGEEIYNEYYLKHVLPLMGSNPMGEPILEEDAFVKLISDIHNINK